MSDRLSRLHVGINTRAHTHTQCNYKYRKREHEFEREQGEGYGKVWREERKGGNDVIIISKNF